MTYHDDRLSGRYYYARRMDTTLWWILDRIADKTMGRLVTDPRLGLWNSSPAANLNALYRVAHYAAQAAGRDT